MSDLPVLESAVLKPKSGPVKQLVVLLHGVGADANDLIGLAPMLQEYLPNAQFSSPNAPFEYDMAPFGRQWFSLADRSPEALLAGVETAAPILDQYLDDQLAMLGLDDSKLAIFSFSQGTMTALYTMFRRAKPCAGIAGFSGAMIGGEYLAEEATAKPPVALIHGNMDDVVPFAAMAMAEEYLQESDIEVRTCTAENVGHGIDPAGMLFAGKFLQEKFGIASSEAA